MFNVLYFAFGFLRMGTTGLTAQAYGRGDGAELRAGLARAADPGARRSASSAAARRPAGPRLGWLFEPSPTVALDLDIYLRIRLFGAPAGLANMVLLGWLLGLQNARGPMALLIADQRRSMSHSISSWCSAWPRGAGRRRGDGLRRVRRRSGSASGSLAGRSLGSAAAGSGR